MGKTRPQTKPKRATTTVLEPSQSRRSRRPIVLRLRADQAAYPTTLQTEMTNEETRGVYALLETLVPDYTPVTTQRQRSQTRRKPRPVRPAPPLRTFTKEEQAYMNAELQEAIQMPLPNTPNAPGYTAVYPVYRSPTEEERARMNAEVREGVQIPLPPNTPPKEAANLRRTQRVKAANAAMRRIAKTQKAKQKGFVPGYTALQPSFREFTEAERTRINAELQEAAHIPLPLSAKNLRKLRATQRANAAAKRAKPTILSIEPESNTEFVTPASSPASRTSQFTTPTTPAESIEPATIWDDESQITPELIDLVLDENTIAVTNEGTLANPLLVYANQILRAVQTQGATIDQYAEPVRQYIQEVRVQLTDRLTTASEAAAVELREALARLQEAVTQGGNQLRFGLLLAVRMTLTYLWNAAPSRSTLLSLGAVLYRITSNVIGGGSASFLQGLRYAGLLMYRAGVRGAATVATAGEVAYNVTLGALDMAGEVTVTAGRVIQRKAIEAVPHVRAAFGRMSNVLMAATRTGLIQTADGLRITARTLLGITAIAGVAGLAGTVVLLQGAVQLGELAIPLLRTGSVSTLRYGAVALQRMVTMTMTAMQTLTTQGVRVGADVRTAAAQHGPRIANALTTIGQEVLVTTGQMIGRTVEAVRSRRPSLRAAVTAATRVIGGVLAPILPLFRRIVAPEPRRRVRTHPEMHTLAEATQYLRGDAPRMTRTQALEAFQREHLDTHYGLFSGNIARR